MLKVRYNLLIRLIPSVCKKTMGALSRLLSLYPVHTALDVRCHFGAPWVLEHEGSQCGVAPYHLIASGSGDIRVWNLSTGQQTRLLTGHTGWVLSVEFSPDANSILSSSEDHTARIWDVNMDDFIDYACTRVFRDFTQVERMSFQLDDTPTCPQFAISG